MNSSYATAVAPLIISRVRPRVIFLPVELLCGAGVPVCDGVLASLARVLSLLPLLLALGTLIGISHQSVRPSGLELSHPAPRADARVSHVSWSYCPRANQTSEVLAGEPV